MQMGNAEGAVDVRSQGGGDLPSADIFRTSEEVLQMRTSALFGSKNFEFFDIYGVSARTGGGGLSQCGYFSDKVEGSMFRDFVRTSFMDDP